MLEPLLRPFRRPGRFLFVAALALATGLTLALPVPGRAQSGPPAVAGAEDPGFQDALALWLDNDESTALPALAALANDGNTAARLLLGLIDKNPSLQGPFLHHIDRNGRIALLRAPGGLSGRNWLTEIADHPLAAAWLTLWSVEADTRVVTAFEALGESVALRRAITVLAAREHASLSLLDPAEIDPDLLYLLWTPANPERRAEIALLVPANHPQRALMGEYLDARDLAMWLENADASQPVTTLCSAVCPEQIAACSVAAYQGLNSHNALLHLGTPAEALVSQSEFLSSPRGRAAVMRRILLAAPMRARRTMLARLGDHVSCLGDAMTAENDRYRVPMPTPAPTD